MGNPFEFRESMKAAFGFTDKTQAQVAAEQRQRERERDRPKPRGKRVTPAPTTNATPRASEIDKMNALLAKAKPRAWSTEG